MCERNGTMATSEIELATRLDAAREAVLSAKEFEVLSFLIDDDMRGLISWAMDRIEARAKEPSNGRDSDVKRRAVAPT